MRQLIKREICDSVRTVCLIQQRHDARKARRGGGCTAKTNEMENLAFRTGRRRNKVRLANHVETLIESAAGKERHVGKVSCPIGGHAVGGADKRLIRWFCITAAANVIH